MLEKLTKTQREDPKYQIPKANMNRETLEQIPVKSRSFYGYKQVQEPMLQNLPSLQHFKWDG